MNICQKCSIEFVPTSWTKKICYNCRCKITSEATKKAMTLEINKKISKNTKIAMSNPEIRKKFLDAMLKARVERFIIKCKICQKEFEVTKCKLNKKYCSPDCYYKDKKPLSKETRNKISESNKKRVENKMHRCVDMFKKDTKLELLFENILKKRNIKYVKQCKIKYKFYDFYLPHKNLLIEIHGDYWHANPKLYKKNQLNKTQLHNIKNDKYKEKLAKENGFRLAVIWEHNLVKN